MNISSINFIKPELAEEKLQFKTYTRRDRTYSVSEPVFAKIIIPCYFLDDDMNKVEIINEFYGLLKVRLLIDDIGKQEWVEEDCIVENMLFRHQHEYEIEGFLLDDEYNILKHNQYIALLEENEYINKMLEQLEHILRENHIHELQDIIEGERAFCVLGEIVKSNNKIGD